MFKAWWAGHKSKEKASKKEFTKLLLSFLFERVRIFKNRQFQLAVPKTATIQWICVKAL